MARLTPTLINKTLHLIRQRTYATSGIGRLKEKLPTAASAREIRGDCIGKNKENGENKSGFWMRDPTTGNWIPETHFGQVDVADLRDKLLPK